MSARLDASSDSLQHWKDGSGKMIRSLRLRKTPNLARPLPGSLSFQMRRARPQELQRALDLQRDIAKASSSCVKRLACRVVRR
jgi:hypothetical protein